MTPFPKTFWPFCLIYLRLFKWQVCCVLLLSAVVAGLTNLNVRFFADITGAIKLNNPESYDTAVHFIILLAVSGFFSIIFASFSRYYFQVHFIIPCQSRMEKDLFSYLLGHSYEYLISKQSGMLITQKEQVKSLPFMLQNFYKDVRQIFDILVKCIMLTLISPFIGLGYLSCLILVIFPGKALFRLLPRVVKDRQKISAIVDGRMLDVVNNLQVIKQFDNIEAEKRHLHTLFAQEYKLKKKNMLVHWGAYNLVGVLTSIMSFSILTASVYFWQKGSVSSADIVFILITLTQGLNGLSELQSGLQTDRQNMATVEQGLLPFTDPHGIVDAKGAKPLKVKGGKIEFRHLDFAYKGSKKPIFKDFNLTIAAGEKVGIVGASGAGKSTLINLLQRAFDVDGGQILIDGQDIAQITQESLHRAVSLIPQDTILFNRSIAANITFGTAGCSLKKIKTAATKAYADDFIREKEDGYDAYVGDKGCLLSGGERQRLAIARAILRQSPILVLDEATSALDSESEQLIQKALDNLIQKQTVIAIAHRLSTLKEMDRIIVLERGKIVEEGKFSELLQQGGKFAKLYKAAQQKGGRHA